MQSLDQEVQSILSGTKTKPASSASSDSPLEQIAHEAAMANGIDPELFKRLIKQESSWNPNAVSSVGAQGLGQLMPDTARFLGVTDPFDPKQNLNASAKYLARQIKGYGGDTTAALVAYNGGDRAVKAWKSGRPYKESQGYVKAIQGEDLKSSQKEDKPEQSMLDEINGIVNPPVPKAPKPKRELTFEEKKAFLAKRNIPADIKEAALHGRTFEGYSPGTITNVLQSWLPIDKEKFAKKTGTRLVPTDIATTDLPNPLLDPVNLAAGGLGGLPKAAIGALGREAVEAPVAETAESVLSKIPKYGESNISKDWLELERINAQSKLIRAEQNVVHNRIGSSLSMDDMKQIKKLYDSGYTTDSISKQFPALKGIKNPETGIREAPTRVQFNDLFDKYSRVTEKLNKSEAEKSGLNLAKDETIIKDHQFPGSQPRKVTIPEKSTPLEKIDNIQQIGKRVPKAKGKVRMTGYNPDNFQKPQSKVLEEAQVQSGNAAELQRRGIITDRETTQKAVNMIKSGEWSEKKLMAVTPGTAVNAETIRASGFIVDTNAVKLHRLASEFQAGKIPAETFVAQAEKTVDLSIRLEGFGSESGRSLREFRFGDLLKEGRDLLRDILCP